ncbi:MAG: hypothetical protein WBF51_06735 [Candidatus Dormiibacterota bacterium]
MRSLADRTGHGRGYRLRPRVRNLSNYIAKDRLESCWFRPQLKPSIVKSHETGHKARSWYLDGQERPRADTVCRWFTTLLWFSVVVGLPEMRGRSGSSRAWPKLV